MDASRASGINPALVVFVDYRPGRRLTHTPTNRGLCATGTQPEASSVATHGTGLEPLTCANPNGYGPPVQVVAGRVAYVTGLKYSSDLGTRRPRLRLPDSPRQRPAGQRRRGSILSVLASCCDVDIEEVMSKMYLNMCIGVSRLYNICKVLRMVHKATNRHEKDVMIGLIEEAKDPQTRTNSAADNLAICEKCTGAKEAELIRQRQ
jgi:hypothetical protein